MRAVDEKMAELKVYLDDKKVPHMVKLETEEAYAYYLQRRPQLLELGTFHSLPKSMLYKLIHQVLVLVLVLMSTSLVFICIYSYSRRTCLVPYLTHPFCTFRIPPFLTSPFLTSPFSYNTLSLHLPFCPPPIFLFFFRPLTRRCSKCVCFD